MLKVFDLSFESNCLNKISSRTLIFIVSFQLFLFSLAKINELSPIHERTPTNHPSIPKK